MIDKGKQIYGWWVNTDTEIHCFCGNYIQITSQLADEEQEIICKTCGQKWFAKLEIVPIEEDK